MVDLGSRGVRKLLDRGYKRYKASGKAYLTKLSEQEKQALAMPTKVKVTRSMLMRGQKGYLPRGTRKKYVSKATRSLKAQKAQRLSSISKAKKQYRPMSKAEFYKKYKKPYTKYIRAKRKFHGKLIASRTPYAVGAYYDENVGKYVIVKKKSI